MRPGQRPVANSIPREPALQGVVEAVFVAFARPCVDVAAPAGAVVVDAEAPGDAEELAEGVDVAEFEADAEGDDVAPEFRVVESAEAGEPSFA